MTETSTLGGNNLQASAEETHSPIAAASRSRGVPIR